MRRAFLQSNDGRKPLPFAIAEKIDNSLKAIMGMDKEETFRGVIKVIIATNEDGCTYSCIISVHMGYNIEAPRVFTYNIEAPRVCIIYPRRGSSTFPPKPQYLHLLDLRRRG